MTNTSINNNGTSISSAKNAIIINGKTIAINMNQSVAIHRYSRHHKTPIILDITRQKWAEQVIEDVCQYDYWEWTDRNVIEDCIEVSKTNDDFDEEAYRTAHARDGIYFDNEYVSNPYTDNSMQVDDVTDTTFYENLIELINDNVSNVRNESFIEVVKNYLRIPEID